LEKRSAVLSLFEGLIKGIGDSLGDGVLTKKGECSAASPKTSDSLFFFLLPSFALASWHGFPRVGRHDRSF
jgi:hypothetical protein